VKPGDVQFIGGRIMSRTDACRVRVEPRAAVDRLGPGTLVCLGYSLGSDYASVLRPGYAAIRQVDRGSGELTFDALLNTLVTAACEGDYVFEYEPPCTRCECRRCQRDRAWDW
jgi:hypothetical protein